MQQQLLAEAEADQNLGELVHDTATGMCRTDPIDWEEFKEQRKNRPVSSRLLNSEDPLEDEAGFRALVVRGKSSKDAGQAWSILMGAVTNILCKERKRVDSRFEALREFLVLKDGKINAKHEMMQLSNENVDALVGKHSRGLNRLKKRPTKLSMQKYLPKDEEIVENLMLAATKKLREAVEEQMLEDGTRMEDVERDWDLMVEKLYTAEDRIEAEKKMWSGSTEVSR